MSKTKTSPMMILNVVIIILLLVIVAGFAWRNGSKKANNTADQVESDGMFYVNEEWGFTMNVADDWGGYTESSDSEMVTDGLKSMGISSKNDPSVGVIIYQFDLNVISDALAVDHPSTLVARIGDYYYSYATTLPTGQGGVVVTAEDEEAGRIIRGQMIPTITFLD